MNNRINFKLSKCFVNGEISKSKELKHEEDCIRMNGIWDQPCTSSDNKCQYINSGYGCNEGTGFCKMPKGIINTSYHNGDLK